MADSAGSRFPGIENYDKKYFQGLNLESVLWMRMAIDLLEPLERSHGGHGIALH